MRKLWQKSGVWAYYLVWPALFVYLYPSRRTRVIIWHAGKILLVRGWLSSGRWSLPGGGLHSGETTTEGAIREVCEETGIRLKPEQCISLGQFRTRRGHRFDYEVFVVRLDTHVKIVTHGLEILDAKWVLLQDMPSVLTVDTVTQESLERFTASVEFATLVHSK